MTEEKKIGRYIVEGILGEGAMGSVFKAHDPNLERTVAIKTMRASNIGKKEDYAEFKERFFLESRANGSLNHPNIVGVYDSGVVEKDPFLVMEFIEGVPLDRFLEEQGDNYLQYYVDMMSQIAAGLDYAHEEGVVHRDVKPGNILVTRLKSGRFRAKIVDFGLAKLKDSKLTQTGYFLGTPSYASPEQVLGGKLDLRSDLFSFGTVAYEALTGDLPFDAESLHSILYKIANEPPAINLERFADYVDVHALACVFRTIFQKDAKARFSSACDFVDELRALTTPLKTVRMAAPGSEQASASEPGMDRTSVAPAVSGELSRSRMEQIREIRSLFQEAISSKNVSSSRYCISELERLGVDISHEKLELVSLRQELKALQREKRKRERARMIKKARGQFELALKTRNLESVRYCLSELEKLKADVSRESQKLEELETKLEREQAEKKRREDEERARYINKQKSQLTRALDEKDLQRSGILIKELGSLLKVDVSSEREALVRLKEEIALEEEIGRTRAAFLDALAEKDLKKCRGVIARLKELGADFSQEEDGIKALKKQLSHEDQRQLKQRVITNARESFRDALQRKNLDSCQYYLRELMQMGVLIQAEERAIASLKRMMAEREANELKASMIEKLREEFHKAHELGNLESCSYYLREMSQLDAEVSEEQKLLEALEHKVRQEDELADNMLRQVRELFKKAIKDDDLNGGTQYLKVLRGLGADVVKEEKLLEAGRKRAQIAADQEKLKAKMVVQFRGKFQEGYRKGNRDTCRYYLKELMQLGADVAQENQLLAGLAH